MARARRPIRGARPGSNGSRPPRRRSTISRPRRRCGAARTTIHPKARHDRNMPEPQPAFQFAAMPQQREAAHLGIWAFLSTEVLFFGGLILAYSVYRMDYPAG